MLSDDDEDDDDGATNPSAAGNDDDAKAATATAATTTSAANLVEIIFNECARHVLPVVCLCDRNESRVDECGSE